MNPPSIISLSGLDFKYAANQPLVLRGLSLDIPTGSLTAILGPNGGGKTTLLHILLGLLSPEAGTLHIAGRAPAEYSRRELSRIIGLVPQNEHIPFDFSLLDYVLLGRAPYLGALEQPGDQDQTFALKALETAGLAAMCHRPVTTLSGGERQLAMIARALAQSPRILLLDEPTSHLDLANRRAVHDVLRRLADEGVTVIFSSHDPNLAASTANHVVLLRSGMVLAAGPAEAVLTAELLTTTYGLPVQVITCDAHRVIVS